MCLRLLELPIVSLFEIGEFLSIVSFKLATDIICGLKDTLHVLLSGPLAIDKFGLSTIDFVLHAFETLLKTRILSGEEGFVLGEDVYFSAKGFTTTLNICFQVIGFHQLVF
jgi:hypothetical protein